MSDTHINAYFADVDEAEKRVLTAHAEWEEAKRRLEVKKREVGYEDPQSEEASADKDEQPKENEDPKPKNNSLFGKK